jgi:uncharacterized membrane protein
MPSLIHRSLPRAVVAAVMPAAAVLSGPAAVASGDPGTATGATCRPTIVALPLPSGMTNGDVLSAAGLRAVGFVADDAGHQHVAMWQQTTNGWTVRDLGSFGFADVNSGLSGTGVNEHGYVSIGINTGAGMAGWVYHQGTTHQLKDFAGGTAAYARAINAHGVIAGEALDAHGNDFAARWSSWTSTPTKLKQRGGFDGSFGQGINDKGEVVGGSFSNGSTPTVATTWSPKSKSAALPTFGADAQASDVNNSGRIVGNVLTAHGQRAAVWTNGKVRSLGVFREDVFSRALGVSEAGWVVGWEGINNPPPNIPRRNLLLWPGSGPARSLLPLTLDWNSDGAYAHAIDENGDVFGASAPSHVALPAPTEWTCALQQSFVPPSGTGTAAPPTAPRVARLS